VSNTAVNSFIFIYFLIEYFVQLMTWVTSKMNCSVARQNGNRDCYKRRRKLIHKRTLRESRLLLYEALSCHFLIQLNYLDLKSSHNSQPNISLLYWTKLLFIYCLNGFQAGWLTFWKTTSFNCNRTTVHFTVVLSHHNLVWIYILFASLLASDNGLWSWGKTCSRSRWRMFPHSHHFNHYRPSTLGHIPAFVSYFLLCPSMSYWLTGWIHLQFSCSFIWNC
jgi:hypothetical protein